ncbi:MAG: class I SAM-dependent methyltransferase [Myxococcota bacterium]
MSFLEPDSPIHRDKLLERALYLDLWAPHLPPGCRVLDLGGGIGRFTTWLLDQGCDVELVDPDLRSLWRAVSFAAGRQGRLDVHWSTGERMPQLPPFDAIIACEVLCYVEDPARVIRRLASMLKPAGALLISVESRWGWAMAADAHPGSIDAFFTGVVHVPGDVWVQTYTETHFRELLAPHFEIRTLLPSHYAFSGPFEIASDVHRLTAREALALEQRLRDHPVSRPLNRAWMAVAQRRNH